MGARKDHNSTTEEFQHKYYMFESVKNYNDGGVVRVSPCPPLSPRRFVFFGQFYFPTSSVMFDSLSMVYVARFQFFDRQTTD